MIRSGYKSTTKKSMVSIIISNYNSGAILKESLESLQKLDYPHFEVIVVDAGSTDGSQEMIKEFFPEVKLIERGKIGISEAINIGIQKAKGRIIVLDFNSDEIASSTWLVKLVDVLESSSDIGAVGGIRLIYDSDGIIDDAGAKIHFFGHQSKIGRGKRYEYYTKRPMEVDYLSCMAVKREIIEKIGLLDEAYYIYGEDADYCMRIRKAGYKIINVPEAVTFHKISSSVGSQTPNQVYFLRRAMLRLILKSFSLPRILIALPWIVFLTAVDGLMLVPPFRKIISYTRYSYLKGHNTLEHFKASLSAIYWNLKNIGSTLKARKSGV